MNKNAILVYIDHSEKCITEFSWLWKSWLMWDINESWDIVAFTHPAAVEEVESKFGHDNLMVVPQQPQHEIDDFWDDYRFVNSFAFFQNPENVEKVANYKMLMKTDCDTFLTRNFKNFKPWQDRIYVGIGAHNSSNHGDKKLLWAIKERLYNISKSLNLRYSGISHVGATWVMSAPIMVQATKTQFTLTRFLLEKGWALGETGHWPGWFRGVASMYAGELAINHWSHSGQIHLGSFDVWCAGNEISGVDLHIHAWPQAEQDLFNKVKFHAGELPKLKYGKIPATAGQYCLLVANENLDYLKMCAKK